MSQFRRKFRKLVSKKKRRLKKDGYDLDMSYVADKIIAMGFPSEGKLEGQYRNSMSDIKGYLDKNHKDHYMVYNLCVEKNRQYDPANFHGRVVKFPFEDHNCPPISMIAKFCEHADNWLKKDDENICVVHCKAGKGRTGVMICAWLLYSRLWDDPVKAMQYYGFSRTHDQKGVTIPSQRRYIHYYFKTLMEPEHPVVVFRLLTGMILHGVPNMDKKGACAPYFMISINGVRCYESKDNIPVVKPTMEKVVFTFPPIPIYSEVKVSFIHKKKKKSGVKRKKNKKMFQFWFNPAFHGDEFILEKAEIDKAFKDKKCVKYPSWFKVELHLTDGDEETQAAAEAMMAASGQIEQSETELAAFQPDAVVTMEDNARAAASKLSINAETNADSGDESSDEEDESDDDDEEEEEYETESETRSEAGAIEEYASSDEEEEESDEEPEPPKKAKGSKKKDSPAVANVKKSGRKSSQSDSSSGWKKKERRSSSISSPKTPKSPKTPNSKKTSSKASRRTVKEESDDDSD